MNAQTNISRISIDLGIIRNYQYDFGNDKLYAFYPEIKIGGKFITNYSEWEFFTSYWNDGIDEVFNIKDAATFHIRVLLLVVNYIYTLVVYYRTFQYQSILFPVSLIIKFMIGKCIYVFCSFLIQVA